MSLIQTPWTSQPQQAVPIDWSNPIVAGLVGGFLDPSITIGGSLISPSLPASIGAIGRCLVSASSASVTSLPGVVSPQSSAMTVLIIARRDGAQPDSGFGVSFVMPKVSGVADSFVHFIKTTGERIRLNTTTSDLTANYWETTTDWPIGVFQVGAYVFNSGSTPTFYRNGVKQTLSYTAGAISGSVKPSLTSQVNLATLRLNGAIGGALVFNRALSEYEVRSLSQNPWQIFKPIPRRIFVPVVSGDPTLYQSLYTNDNSFYAPAVSVGAVTLTPSLFSNSNTFHAATVTLGGATQTITPSLYSNTNTFHAPSVTTGSVTLTPALFSNTNSFFGAVVTLDSDKILYPSLVSNSNSFYGPTVSVGAVSLLPSLFVNSNTFYNHVVGGALTDSEKIDLILDILSNRQTLDATTGLYTLYADDGVTVLKTAQAWEDAEGTQPYRGRGLKRLDALQ